MNASGSANKNLILAAMIFAVSMTFIDMTIVAIAVPSLQEDLSLSSTGVQWIINGYLLSLSALFAFGGRLADIAGHRRMVVLGVIVFATASGLCGATPTGSLDEVWLITFRIVQGAGAAIMFPAALAIVLGAFPVRERGRAMAIFFAITGGLTSIGPLAGGYLVEISWRTIFWVNIPVAIIALVLTAIAKPDDHKHPAPLDYRGTVLISGGMGLAILGLQQSSVWGWGSAITWVCIAAGLALIAAFIAFELRVANPLIRVRIFENRAFAVDNVILFLLMIPLRPALLLRQHVRADLSRRKRFGNRPLPADLLRRLRHRLAVGRQDPRPGWGEAFGGTRLCGVAAVGFALWAHSLPDLSVSSQWYYIVLAGAGVGLVLGPANTDALNRLPAKHYGEATGITQTVRNFGSSLGLAVLGTVLVLENKANLESTLGAQGVPKVKADQIADSISQGSSSSSAGFAEAAGKHAQQLLTAVQHDFALATRTVFYVMAGVMALAFVIALAAMPAGRVEEAAEKPSVPSAALSP